MRGRGFTLVEVLVALAVLAIALGAAVRAVSAAAAAQARLETRTLAQWVAANLVAEQRALGAWPDPGRSDGTAVMGRRAWRWVLTVSRTPDPDLRRLEVAVAPEEAPAQTATRLVAFLARP
ncbi:type II secretion system minor pseudopilin GspI [Inmirania thermothiophila]|uniref:Type II secretion system protein I n=1 Tax=Inmirania thermothiophila TaxID=1750597 RepID=A0A3N1XSD9_9GAMM|nr:type II secretion system minor pseudopilin GspI [Inmirania thermothiophila]ROR29566.1 general secretion pathway protein I [Inmirania thermothiophila]